MHSWLLPIHQASQSIPFFSPRSAVRAIHPLLDPSVCHVCCYVTACPCLATRGWVIWGGRIVCTYLVCQEGLLSVSTVLSLCSRPSTQTCTHIWPLLAARQHGRALGCIAALYIYIHDGNAIYRRSHVFTWEEKETDRNTRKLPPSEASYIYIYMHYICECSSQWPHRRV